jgi:hypothetical protein
VVVDIEGNRDAGRTHIAVTVSKNAVEYDKSRADEFCGRYWHASTLITAIEAPAGEHVGRSAAVCPGAQPFIRED